MVICSDTTFLFSIYRNDSNTDAAVSWNTQNPTCIVISRWDYFELMNALRFAEGRRSIGVGNFLKFLGNFKYHSPAGRLLVVSRRLADRLAEANRLSTVHALTGEYRSSDILYIAGAKVIDASHIVTFDANQKRLAEKEQMTDLL